MLRSALLLICFFSIAGCDDSTTCSIPGDVVDDAGRCVPGLDGGTPTDAGVDAEVDAEVDADGSSVECAVNADCAADRPTCEGNVCVASCDRELCTTNFPGATPACDADTGSCVACMPDEFEGVDCMEQSCDPSTRTCTATPLGSLGMCAACVRSSECGTVIVGTVTASMACVETFFGPSAESAGSFCLIDSAEVLDCPRGTPFTLERAPVDDSTMNMYCTPTTLSTCPAVFDVTLCAGVDASVCGVAGLDDATCNTGRCRSHCSLLDPFSCGHEGETCVDRGGEADFCRI